jgi:hypothetical protein
MTHAEKIGLLMFKYMREELSSEEEKELTAWRNASHRNEEFFKDETNPKKLGQWIVEMFDEKKRVADRIREQYPDFMKARKIKPVIRVLKITGLAVAAMLAIIVAANVYVYRIFVMPKKDSENRLVLGGDRVISSRHLCHFVQGFLAGNASLISKETKDGHMIGYVPEDAKARDIDTYMKMFTPSQEDFTLIFPDSTVIKLNELTVVKYPSYLKRLTIPIFIDGSVAISIQSTSKHIYLITADSSSRQYIGQDGQPSTASRQPSTINGQSIMLNPGEEVRVKAGKISVSRFIKTNI